MKLTVGLLALLALGYLSTVLAAVPASRQHMPAGCWPHGCWEPKDLEMNKEDAEIADREPCEDVADCISEVQVINREDAEIVTGPGPCEDVADCMH